MTEEIKDVDKKASKLFTAKNAKKSDFKETIKTVLYALAFALIFRSFAYEPFHIPSGSMKSNLLVGDYLFVSKFSYGYSNYSFPSIMKYLPIEGRIFGKQPKRGDVIVFHPSKLHVLGDSYIKRLIGLPGDKVQVKQGIVYINDVAMKKEYIDEWKDADLPVNAPTLQRYKETTPEGVSYEILHEADQFNSDQENTKEYIIPAKHYFLMGDNRDNSRDSRYEDPVGFIPEENLIGRADLILFSWNCSPICKDRLFLSIK
jgi:signal peptidase I